MNRSGQFFISALALGALVALAGCGGGTGDNPNGGKAFNNGSGSGTSSGSSGGTTATVPAPVVPPPPVAGVASLVLTLADPTTGGATTAVPAIARAIVRDANGVAVPNSVVTFAVANTTIATLVPSAGTALTDAAGTATVRVNAASLSAAGATTLTATGQAGSAGVTGSIGFAVGAANVTIGNFTIGSNPLSAFGTTSVSVTVSSNGVPVTSPQTVSFSSPCAGSGKAVLTPTVLTGAGGVATASYRDNGCGGTDTITASVSGLATATQNITITIPSAGSIQFVSATPTSITLKGTGGAGRVESSQVVFKVVDTGGNPLSTSQTVNFSLSTAVGGITFSNGLTTATATSDPTTGQAFITVQAGTIATPVRVLATTTGAGGVTLSTQSDQLTISTGIPDQSSMSISATQSNIEGLAYDGLTTVLTVRLADHFSNPVPDGTTVNFVAEGGSITSFCNTSAGGCSVTMTSQALKPANGRVSVLAYAIGEESFTDLDGDGYADKVNSVGGTSELFDFNFLSTDIPEAFLDADEDGVHSAHEPFIDFNSDGQYNGADGKYNGVLCNESATPGSSAGTCSTQKSVHIFRNATILFSGSNARITTDIPGNAIVFAPCTTPATYIPSTTTIHVTITDGNGNAMPAGSSVAFSTTSGSITSTPTTFSVPSTTACQTGVGTYTDINGIVRDNCPGGSTAPLSYTVGMKSGVTVTGNPLACTPVSPGIFTITVTTPKGTVTTYQASVTN